VNDAAIVAAAEIAGLTFSDDERKQMLSGLKGQPQTLAGAANQLTATNLTGHPACILPNGFRDGTPINVSITFLGSLFGEANLLRVAHAYQQATGFHLRHPALV
jgi:Asp-tRNA(Asn)/Glu-tRNA(Gln) amidotransferase A subunit family amidase